MHNLQYDLHLKLRQFYKFLDFAQLKNLSFAIPDTETFRCLALALRAAERGGSAGAVLNGANEAAVDLFLNSKIKFLVLSLNVISNKKNIGLSSTI